MKNLKNIAIVFLSVILITSCSKDFLNKKSQTEFSSEDEWGDPALTATYINGIYNEIPADIAMNAAMVDEARSRDADNLNFNQMIITQDDGEYGGWSGAYSAIRHCNIALENISKASFDPTPGRWRNITKQNVGRGSFFKSFLIFQVN